MKVLFDDAIYLVRAAKQNWLWLCVSDINYRMKSFYQKMNFITVGPGTVFNIGTDPRPSSIMALKL